MGLSGRTVALLASGAIGWLILFIALVGGCDHTVTKTVTPPPVTVTVVETVSSPATTGAETTTATTSVAPNDEVASLVVRTAHGKVDPVADVPRVLDFDVYAPSETALFVKYRPSGGAPCAATEYSDSGEELVSGEDVNGPRHYRTVQTWEGAGRFLFCMWLGSSDDDADSKVFSQTVKFRAPRANVAFRTSPSYVAVNRPVTLILRGSSEAPRVLLAKYRSAGGAACAPTEYSDSGEEFANANVNGGFNEKVVWTFDAGGTYVVCAWVATDSSDTAPVALKKFYLTVH